MNAPTPPIGYWEPFVLWASAIEEGQPQPILLDSSSGTVWRVPVVLKNLACTAAAWLQQEQTPHSVGHDELTREVASLRRLARSVMSAPEADRCLAAELAGDLVVMNV